MALAEGPQWLAPQTEVPARSRRTDEGRATFERSSIDFPDLTTRVAADLDDRCRVTAVNGSLWALRFLLGVLADLGEHVTRAKNEHVLTVNGDLGASELRTHDASANRQIHLDQLAGVIRTPTRTNLEHFALLRLLLCVIGDDEAADCLLQGLVRPNDDPVSNGAANASVHPPRKVPELSGWSSGTVAEADIAMGERT
jgi:hypothetical protein